MMLAPRLGGDAVLRLLDETHVDELLAHVAENRTHLDQWLELPIHSREDAAAFIRHNLDALATGTGMSLGLWVGGHLAGVVGLGRVDHQSRSASIGYWIGAAYGGRGLVTEAVRALIDHAFDTFDLHRVEISCPAAHRRSRAIPERLGFREEGTRRQAIWLHGDVLDEVLYGLLAPEWGR